MGIGFPLCLMDVSIFAEIPKVVNCKKKEKLFKGGHYLREDINQGNLVKFLFSKKATKIDIIFTVDLTFTT